MKCPFCKEEELNREDGGDGTTVFWCDDCGSQFEREDGEDAIVCSELGEYLPVDAYMGGK